MSKREKLLKEFENNPKDVRFETLKNLLESEGWKASNNGSSHWRFRKEGKKITTPLMRVADISRIIRILKALWEMDGAKRKRVRVN